MDALSFLSGVGMTIAAVLSLLNIRDKLWPKPPQPHPLQPALIDIARAIRERRFTKEPL